MIHMLCIHHLHSSPDYLYYDKPDFFMNGIELRKYNCKLPVALEQVIDYYSVVHII